MKPSVVMKIIATVSLILVSCLQASSLIAQSAPQQRAAIRGIDVSSFQGSVDFDKVKSAGISYVFIRATDGITVQDPDFKTNYRSAKTAGIAVGAYHFYEIDDDPNSQLENFTSVVSLEAGDLPPVVDIEKLHDQDDSNLVQNLQKFLNGLETHYGTKPIIYSGLSFANQYITDFSDYPLWMAEYRNTAPTIPKGWSDWTFWQWSQTGTTEGMVGDVDLDRFNGDAESFRRLLIK